MYGQWGHSTDRQHKIDSKEFERYIKTLEIRLNKWWIEINMYSMRSFKTVK
jgi:hypothetical protein